MEHAVKSCRHNWKIWENLIHLYLNEGQFFRVVSSIKQLININHMERINVKLMHRVATCFMNKFLNSEGLIEDSQSKRALLTLFELFELVLREMSKDTDIIRLYCRLTQSLTPDDYPKILALKLREIKSIQTAHWQYDNDAHKRITSTIEELKQIMGDKFEDNEEVKCFVKNTFDTIEQNVINK